MEIRNGMDVGRAYAEVVENTSATSLGSFFERHISKETIVVTDKWNGYKPWITRGSSK